MDLQHKPIQERRLFARLGHLISVALGLAQDGHLGSLEQGTDVPTVVIRLVWTNDHPFVMSGDAVGRAAHWTGRN